MIGIPLVQNQAIRNAAAMGRRGDTTIAHLTPGEVVIPKSAQTPDLMANFARHMRRHGRNPAQYIVGSRMPSVNPRTGLQEFADQTQAIVGFDPDGNPIYANDQSQAPKVSPTDALHLATNIVPTGGSTGGGGLFSGVGTAVNNLGTSIGFGGPSIAPGGSFDMFLDEAPSGTATGALGTAAPLTSVLGGAGIGAGIGGIIGPAIGEKPLGSTIGGGLGGALGAAYGGSALASLGMGLGAAGGPVGMIAGALLGTVLGGMFGGSGVHHQGGVGTLGINSSGQLAVSNVQADNYDPGAVRQFGQNYADQFNNFLSKYNVKLKGSTPFTYSQGPAGTQPQTWQGITAGLLGNGASLDTGDAAVNAKLAQAIQNSPGASDFGTMLSTLGQDITQFRNQAATPSTPANIDWAHYGSPGTAEMVLSHAPQFAATAGPAK